jgi:hypothetical protein
MQGRGGCYKRNAPIQGRGGCYKRNAPIQGRGGCYKRNAPMQGRGGCYKRNAPMQGRGGCYKRNAPIQGQGGCYKRNAPMQGRGRQEFRLELWCNCNDGGGNYDGDAIAIDVFVGSDQYSSSHFFTNDAITSPNFPTSNLEFVKIPCRCW